MKKLILLFCSLFSMTVFAQPDPIGWASLNGGTIGGWGGETVIITNRSEFLANVTGDDSKILLIQDTIELVLYERIKVFSNKTIFGLTQDAMLRFGGLELVGDNIIIQNLVIGDFYDGDWSGTTNSTDCLTIFGENIWVDHCWLWAGADGLLDIRSGNGSIGDYITVSYCRFSDHNKVSLIGSSNNSTQDRNHLRVTFHHCWYDGTIDKGVHQRMPRIRFGDVHVFNNYFEELGSYGVAARIESDVVVENTYFRNSPNPHEINDVGVGLEDPDLVAINNIYELCSGSQTTSGDAWTPSEFYDYVPTPTWDVPALVMNEAGPFNPVNNIPPVAITDTLYNPTAGGLNIEVTLNDIDEDGGDLRLAQLANNPPGIGFIKENRIIYAPLANAVGVDTILYTLVDTQGGLDTGMVLIYYDVNATREQNQLLDLSIYPNPTSGSATIDIPKNFGAYVDIRAVSQTGNIVAEIKKASFSQGGAVVLNTSDWPSGIYLVTAESESKMITGKLIVN